MALPDLVGVAQVLDAIAWFASPWRYLLSPSYRERKQAEWETLHPAHRYVQIGGGLFGGVLGIVVIVCIVSALRNPQ